MSNERLRAAIAGRGLSVTAVAGAVQVDAKTVERWVALDRVPHARHRAVVCGLLAVQETQLWPVLLGQQRAAAGAAAELVAIYPTRGLVPQELWHRLIHGARDRVDVLAYAALFLTDWDPDVGQVLAQKVDQGVKVRLLLGDPDSAAVASRGAEEGLGEGLAARIRISEANLSELIHRPDVETRRHGTTLYNSIYRFDNEVLVNTHAFGFQAAQSPVLHLRATPEGRLFEHYTQSWERAWQASSAPAESGTDAQA